ncbi:MAG: PHP domain-containing protein, partial [Firmicutes bacterium]|nr:PHP domain-containing protein [Bacillota bacterium]
MHSIYSPDSHATMDEMCEAAIDAGLQGICFTEHVDLDPHYYSYGSYDYAKIMKDAARCKEKYGDRLIVR